MKFYEVEFLKNNQNYTKTIKAENLIQHKQKPYQRIGKSLI